MEQGRDQLDQQTPVAHRNAVRLAREGDHEGASQVLAELYERRDDLHSVLADDRKALRQQQLEVTRERQDEGCRALIEERATAFQQIKDRQKEERAEFKELQAQREAGQPYDVDRLRQLLGHGDGTRPANDNREPGQGLDSANQNQPRVSLLDHVQALVRDGEALFADTSPADTADRGPRRDEADLVAGGIGAAVEIGLRIMGGVLPPPSAEEQAMAKARAIREEQLAPARAAALEEEKSRSDFTRHASSAVREVDAEYERERKLDREDRDRGRQRER